MPRPKVRLEDRQRAVQACLPCKASKKKCEGGQPCSNCIRRRAVAFCNYVESPYAKHQRRSSQSQSSNPHPVAFEPASNTSPVQPASGHSVQGTLDYDNATPREQPAPKGRPLTEGRMLLNSRGERVYIGEFASLSFLQFLRHTIRQQMGPSLFTENTRRNLMLEVANTNDTATEFVEDEDQKTAMIEVYFAATNGLLDLFSREEVEIMTKARVNSQDRHNYAKAALDLIVAIGAQCRAADVLDRRYASILFSRAQRIALKDALEDPCVDMVRCFLLMTFYMLGACRRNAAFMYLGIASQASSALGLHVTEQYRHFSPDDQVLRLRTLKSLRVLDVVYCSILGRPYSTSAIKTESVVADIVLIPAAASQNLALHTSFEVCAIVAEITPKLDAEGWMGLTTAEDLLKRLQDWSAALPADMRRFNRSTDGPLTLQEQAQTIGNIHVSCVYYFAVMLTTRPFLISHLMAYMSNGTLSATVPTDSTPGEVADLAQACIDSAILMANMCYEALQSGILLKQMCIVKAWIFAAGLVLGFSMFAQGESRFDMDDSFSNAREVLRSLSANSPQAEHYYEILTGFSDVIQRRRQHLSRGNRPSRNKYVDQILTFDITPSATRSQSTFSPQTPSLKDPAPDAQDGTTPDDGIGDYGFQMPDLTQWPLENGGGFDFGMFGWDNFAMQITENFSFENDPAWGIT